MVKLFFTLVEAYIFIAITAIELQNQKIMSVKAIKMEKVVKLVKVSKKP
jgi:hypothetical protein